MHAALPLVQEIEKIVYTEAERAKSKQCLIILIYALYALHTVCLLLLMVAMFAADMYWSTAIMYMYMYCSGTLPVNGDF